MKDWRPAQEFQKRVSVALKNLKLFQKVKSDVKNNSPKSLETEQLIIDVEQKLPKGYSSNLSKRCLLAKQTINLCQQAESMVNRPNVTERQLSDCWQQVQGLKNLFDNQIYERLEQASYGAIALENLSQIPTGLNPLENDRAILNAYDEDLLQNCDEAAPYRQRYETAKKRRTLLRLIEQALANGENLEVKRLAEHSLLKGITLSPEIQTAIESATRSAETVARMIELVQGNEEHEFVRELDIEVLRTNWNQFETYHPRIRQWLGNGALSTKNISLHGPRVGTAVKRTGGIVQIKWRWPARITDRCLITISRTQMKSASDIQKASQRFEISKQHYEQGSGYAIAWKSEIANAYINIWAIVELGGERFYSAPLTLCRVPR